jgi:hypothetical protein
LRWSEKRATIFTNPNAVAGRSKMSLQRIKMRVVPKDGRWHIEVQSQDLEDPEMATGLSMGFATQAEAERAMKRVEEQGRRRGLPGQTRPKG